MISGSISEAGESAAAAFASGLYCAESVVAVIARQKGIESDLLPRVATAFCSGMARTCGTCGALTGGIMGIGLVLGRSRPDESVAPAYAATQSLIRAFEEEFGARDCDKLLGCDLGTEAGRETFREQQLGRRCAVYTAKTAELVAGILAEAVPDAEKKV